MRIVFFHLAESFGGAEKLTNQLLPYFQGIDGLKLDLVTNLPHLFSVPQGVELIPFPGPGFFRRFQDILFQVRKLREILQGARVVLAVMHYASFLASLAAQLLPKRPQVLALLHGPIRPALATILRSRRFFLSWAARILCRFSDAFVVPTEGMKQELLSYYGVKAKDCWVIPLGLDWEEIKKAPKRLSPSPWPPRKRRLLWMARLSPEKNPFLLLRALSYLQKYPWHLCILGDGPLKESLKKEIKRRGLEERTTFLGFQKNVYPFLYEAEIFIHTCLFEGYGLAFLEAMACGCAVVVQDCPYGPREILDHGRYGLLFQGEGLKEALKLLLLDPKKQALLAQKGYQRACTYHLEKTVIDYLELLQCFL